MKVSTIIAGLVGALLIGNAPAIIAEAHADAPACVVGKDTIWNNPVCRDCISQHFYDTGACTVETPPASKPSAFRTGPAYCYSTGKWVPFPETEGYCPDSEAPFDGPGPSYGGGNQRWSDS